MNSWYIINQLPEGEAEVRIYEEIGYFGVTAKQFAEDLGKLDAKTIHLRLNTPGGEVFDGTAIYNSLRNHSARIISHIDGIAASAGSFIALAGDEVRMADNAYMMIHEARGGAFGEAEDMRKQADLLDKVNDTIAGMYSRKAGRGKKYWRGKMADESWFTAAEAKAEGLVDAVDAPKEDINAKFDFKIYNKLPDAVAARWAKPQITTPEVTPRGEAVPETSTQEVQPMAETTTTAPPASNPAAGSGTSQGNTQIVQDTRDLTEIALARHKQIAHSEGKEIGVQNERDRMKAIIEACPDNPAMALEAFMAGQEPGTVKLAYDSAKRATVAAEARAATEKAQADREIARLNALLVTGGMVNGVSMTFNTDTDAPTMEPKTQAEWEWENKPGVRKTASSKEIYVFARTAELAGTHRTFSREQATA